MTGFISLVVLFGVIGGLRGWAKEIIVAFSAILALFVEHVLLLPELPLKEVFNGLPAEGQFYTRTVLFVIITIFGYASPTIVSKLGTKVARERLQDILLGFFIGLLNGFLIVGTLLSFLSAAHYGVPENMWAEQQKTDNGNPVMRDGKPVMETDYLPDATGIGGIVPPEPDSPSANLMAFLPPEWIEEYEVILYVSVAVAFIFVIIVFI
jgi:uncharacterized membrane protein required for colicin V production